VTENEQLPDVLERGAAVASGEGTGGFLAAPPNPYRYDGNHDLDPLEVSGIIANLVPRGARVLDVGCGTGALSVLLRDVRDASVVGIEPDSSRAARARERGIEAVTGVLSESLLGTLGQFDVAIYADVLEHLVDPLSELVKVAPFLKPGGVVVISVPNVAHWSVRLDLLRGRFRYAEVGIMDATHLRWFTEETLRQLLEQAGIEMLSIQRTAGVTLPCYWYSPTKYVPSRIRDVIVRRASRWFPRLFGGQHVVAGRFCAARRAA
jgi:methionine biosynthesis protein MetW